ncbi:hypothetical protein C0992_005490 [Termitomyces sp. T32_za158]|nr:hypothetical protein C0992_005490 [Termitomyces sp. T32_za158]
MSTVQPAVVATVAHEPKAPDVPVEESLLDQQDEEMDKVPLTREDLEFMDHFKSMAPSAGQKVGPTSRGLAGLSHAPNVLRPSKNHRGRKLPILIDNLELVDFPADIPMQAKPAQLLFMKEVIFPALPSQLTVVKLTTDPHTPAQYDGLTATVATGKGKQRAVPALDDDSNYGQSQSEEEEEAEEGESAAQHFQCMQRNKKLTKKKANRAKAAWLLRTERRMTFLAASLMAWGTPYELERLYKYYANLHVPQRDHIVAYMLLSELKDFTQRCDVALHNRTMTLLCSDPAYWDLVNPMQGPEDLLYAEKRHIPSRFLHVKDDGTTVLHVTRTSDPNVPFNLNQIAQYALIFGRPGMENT